MPGVFDPSRFFTTKPHPFSLQANAVDLIDTKGRGFGVPLGTISISEVGANGQSTMTYTIEDPKKALAIPALARVQFNDHLANEVIFAGYNIGRGTITYGGQQGYAINARAVDYSYLLDTTYVPALSHKAGKSDQTLIQSVVAAAMRGQYIYTHTSLVTSTNASMPAMDFSNISLRAAIESIQAAAGEGRHYYVDFLGRLHYWSGVTEAGMGAAPYAITDHTPSAGGERAPEDLQLEYDESQLVNCVYIFGGAAKGSGWEKDVVSIANYGLRQGNFNAPHCMTAAHRASVGRHFLGLHKDPIVRGSFSLSGTDTGWRVGQTMTLTNAALGISAATYPIVQIDTTFDGGSGHRTRRISFGDLPASGRRRPAGGGDAAPAAGGTLGAPGRAILAPVRTIGSVLIFRDGVFH